LKRFLVSLVALLLLAGCCHWHFRPDGAAGYGVYIEGDWDYPSPVRPDGGPDGSDQYFRL